MSERDVRDRGCGAVFVVSAPSGAGKSTLVKRLVASVGGLGFCVSHTTRPRRADEEDGRDYHFVDAAAFGELRERGELLEWAEVHGHLYGTGRTGLERILDGGDDAVLDLDVQGAASVRRARADAILMFVLPPDFAELGSRLESRGTRGGELERRLRTASREILEADRFDYLVVNESVDAAAAEFAAIVLAERCRRPRRQDLLDRVAATFPGS